MRRTITTAALVLLAVAGHVVLLAPSRDEAGPSRFGFPAAAAAPTEHGPGYRSELARIDQRLAAAERLSRAAPRSWMRRAELVELHLERGALTGDLRHYQSAERQLEAALALGPHVAELRLLRAQLSFTLHRFDRVESDLVLPERAARREGDEARLAGILALRGSLAFERGQYEEAQAMLESALQMHRSYDALSRLAHLHFKTCRFETAARLLDEAAGELPPKALRARAWVHLQRGLMALDRSRYPEALASYRKADAIYPGWWLVQEHIAEIDALEGRGERARRTYERVVAETGSAELMGALAGLLEATEPERAAALRRRARERFERELVMFPEASYGHALDHFLELEPDAGHAVLLAERNHALRPNGEAGTKLAQAYMKAGRIEDARAAIARVRASSWCTAEAHETAAAIAEASGDQTSARREASLAAATRRGR